MPLCFIVHVHLNKAAHKIVFLLQSSSATSVLTSSNTATCTTTISSVDTPRQQCTVYIDTRMF